MNATPKLNKAATSYHIPPFRERVLIVVHGDGWIEVFAERHVDVRIQIAPHMSIPEGERLAEEYIEAALPARFRDLYFPGFLRAADLARVIKPSDIERCTFNVELVRILERAGKILRGEDKEGRAHGQPKL